MLAKAGPYQAYQPARLPWISDLPSHWEVRRLRHLVNVIVSNADKNVTEGETAVRLCNYVDVYRHDRIDPAMEFMSATASEAEINRFRLRESDVVVTKDSEDWREIGVPAYVAGEAEDLICGYHLAILRPRGVSGGYLFRCLQAPVIYTQWSVSATGVTRYGLPQVSIKDLLLPLPPRSEQDAAVRFLGALDRWIAAYTQ